MPTFATLAHAFPGLRENKWKKLELLVYWDIIGSLKLLTDLLGQF